MGPLCLLAPVLARHTLSQTTMTYPVQLHSTRSEKSPSTTSTVMCCVGASECVSNSCRLRRDGLIFVIVWLKEDNSAT